MRIYSAPTLFQVTLVRDALEYHGVQTELRNEFASGAAGELAPMDVWPELWLLDPDREERARQVIAELENNEGKSDWLCSFCNAENPAGFELCWSCGERNEQTTGSE